MANRPVDSEPKTPESVWARCSVRVDEVEELFASLCLNARPIPGYSAFARQFRALGQIAFQFFGCERLQSVVTGKRPLSQSAASGGLQSFLRLPNKGALIIRIGFWGFLIIIIV